MQIVITHDDQSLSGIASSARAPVGYMLDTEQMRRGVSVISKVSFNVCLLTLWC